MKRTAGIAAALAILGMLWSCGKDPAVTAEDIAGGWEAIEGGREAITLDTGSGGNAFSEFLHDRLIRTGVWTLKNNILTIVFQDGSKKVFSRVGLEDGLLRLDDERYQRPRPLEQKARDLLDALARSGIAAFSEPSDTEFTWNDSVSGRTMAVKGRKIAASIAIRKDFSELAPITRAAARFLFDEGFVQSDRNITEIVTGYERGALKALVVTRTDPEAAAGATAWIDVVIGVARR
jgi:hypothetical protein